MNLDYISICVLVLSQFTVVLLKKTDPWVNWLPAGVLLASLCILPENLVGFLVQINFFLAYSL